MKIWISDMQLPSHRLVKFNCEENSNCYRFGNLERMMKVALILFCLTFITINLHADVKWIPIEPINSNENTKPKNKLPQPPPANNLLENVKIIQQLLDNTTDKEELNMDSEPNWFLLDNAQNR